jgi:hypothetical protein
LDEGITKNESKLDYLSLGVDQLVTKHLSAQGRPDPRGGEGSVVFGVQTKLEPLLSMHLTH